MANFIARNLLETYEHGEKANDTILISTRLKYSIEAMLNLVRALNHLTIEWFGLVSVKRNVR